MRQNLKNEVPIWEKCNLTIDEAVAYFNIGECKLREMANMPDCPFVLYIGTKRIIKRVKLEQYLENEYSI